MIVEKIEALKRSRIEQWPVRSNRASDLGHDCIRYLVLNRIRWQEKTLHDVNLQTIFDEGNLHEKAVLRDLQDAGLNIIEQQRAFEWPEYQITGHIDAKLAVNGNVIPLEIKSSSPFMWQSLNTIQDLYNGKYHYLRKYPAQMTCYLLMDEKPEGLFLFKNKQTGALKEIPMSLDYDLGEKLLKKAEAINKHVADGTLPDCIPYDEQICGDCGFEHICLPDVKRDALEIQTDPELEAKIERWFELKSHKSEYDTLDKEVKAQLKNQEKIVIGDYLIMGKIVQRKGFTVADGEYWKTTIKLLEV